MQLTSYASDLLEDAMNLAQTKAINSFSFRDTFNTLTELWGYCYERIALIDPGYFSKTIRLTKEVTHLPPCVKNTIRVYSARDVVGFSRKIFKEAGMNDLTAPLTFHVSGNDIYCKDVTLRTVWCEYIPEPCTVFFTKNNRDPKMLWQPGQDKKEPIWDQIENANHTAIVGHRLSTRGSNNRRFKFWELVGEGSPIDQQVFVFRNLVDTQADRIDKTDFIVRQGYDIRAFILDFPYLFITYQQQGTDDYESYIIKDLLSESPSIDRYNAFDYSGRGTNVMFMTAKYNDYTGLGVSVYDKADGSVKELGWTPDTKMIYPSRIMYNYMVATLAQRFAAMNGSTVMAVELALVNAQEEMGNWMKKNKSAWVRANNVVGPTLGDWMM